MPQVSSLGAFFIISLSKSLIFTDICEHSPEKLQFDVVGSSINAKLKLIYFYLLVLIYMQLRLFTQILPGVATASVISALAWGIATTTSNQPSYAGNNKFFCDQEGKIPVTKVRTSRGPETFIRWVVKDFKKFPPSQRCKIVSTRLQRYYDNGSLFIRSEFNLNNYPVLCIANRRGVPCTSDNVLVTLKPGSDPGKVYQQIIAFRRGVAGKPLDLSGKCRPYTEYDGDLYLDVKQLVDDKQCGE